jgi:hypothetical protein
MAEAIEDVNTVAGSVSLHDHRPSRHAKYSWYPTLLPAGDRGW